MIFHSDMASELQDQRKGYFYEFKRYHLSLSLSFHSSVFTRTW